MKKIFDPQTRRVEEDERVIQLELARCGLVTASGYHMPVDESDEFYPTSRLTSLGYSTFKDEKFRREHPLISSFIDHVRFA